jgi:hypothetical protein
MRQIMAGDGELPRPAAAEPPCAIAHIGFLFSCLVDVGQLSFLGRSPDSIFYAPS